jgi:hypothetical protein
MGRGILRGKVTATAADEEADLQFVVQLVGVRRPGDHLAGADDRVGIGLVADRHGLERGWHLYACTGGMLPVGQVVPDPARSGYGGQQADVGLRPLHGAAVCRSQRPPGGFRRQDRPHEVLGPAATIRSGLEEVDHRREFRRWFADAAVRTERYGSTGEIDDVLALDRGEP